MYDQSSDLRELSSTEIDVVAGGFPDAQLFGPGSNITFGAGPVTRENGNDRQANANLINARDVYKRQSPCPGGPRVRRP